MMGNKKLTERQQKLLEMLKWFHKYCKDNNYTYYVIGGTMLGTIRHGGFIPWDDDIDVAMPRDDYNRIVNDFKNKKDHFFLESPFTGNDDYYHLYSKLYDTNTTLLEDARRNCVRGIYIDVFPLDGIGNTIEESIKNYNKVDRLHMFYLTRTCAITKERAWYKNISIFVSRLIPSFIVNDHSLAKKIDKLSSSFGYKHNSYIGNLLGAYRKKEIMKKEIFGEPTEYDFEDTKIYGIEHYEEYLTHLYGDWRKLPPKEKQQYVHKYIEMDLNKPYM